MANHKRIGETVIARNGQKMTIIAYKDSRHIDVQFEDGAIVKDRQYNCFKNGNIANPSIKKNSPFNNAAKRIGEISAATNGQKMTIIAYRINNDIDIQFEDGTVITGTTYQKFKSGKIRNPNCTTKRKPYKNRVGEVGYTINGQKMTIIDYRNSTDIDVQFEDGTIRKNVLYSCFRHGKIKNPNVHYRVSHLGEERYNTKGEKMTIIKFNGSIDIDVQFENGGIAKNKTYHHFKEGKIRNPLIFLQRLNETNISKKGQKMTIIAYRNVNDIDIQLDNGTIVTGQKYHDFKRGYIYTSA